MALTHLISVGAFGNAVAERLTATGRDIVRTNDGAEAWPATTSSAWPSAALRILLTWREAPELAEVIDARSADWGTPWLPVVLEHPRLRVGPVVVPGAGACYRCYRLRRAQHEADRTSTVALHKRYDADPAAGPSGFLPHHVSLAAALIELELDRFDAGNLAHHAGTVRFYHLLEHQVSTASVVGVHGCDRCRRDTRQRSTWLQLADDLSGVQVNAGAAS